MGLPENRLVWLHTSLESWREKLKAKASHNSLCVRYAHGIFVQLATYETFEKHKSFQIASRSCALAAEEKGKKVLFETMPTSQ